MHSVITFTLTKPEICSGTNSRFVICKGPPAFLGRDRVQVTQGGMLLGKDQKKKKIEAGNLLDIRGVYLYSFHKDMN